MIIPNQKSIRGLASELLSSSESDKWEDLCRNPKIVEHVLKDLQTFGQSVGLNKMEIPSKIKLCSEEWTTANALVTPALKIRRKNIKDFYETDINRLYGKWNEFYFIEMFFLLENRIYITFNAFIIKTFYRISYQLFH